MKETYRNPPKIYDYIEIYLKKNDSTAVKIDGYLVGNQPLRSDKETLLKEILERNKYCLVFYEINIKEWFNYKKLFNFKQGIYGEIEDLPELKLFKENFPIIFDENRDGK